MWVKRPVQALAGGDASEEAVLDWLCLHLDPADLPRRFAGAAQSRAAAAGLRVVGQAAEAAAAARRWAPIQICTTRVTSESTAKPAGFAGAFCMQFEREKEKFDKASARDERNGCLARVRAAWPVHSEEKGVGACYGIAEPQGRIYFGLELWPCEEGTNEDSLHL